MCILGALRQCSHGLVRRYSLVSACVPIQRCCSVLYFFLFELWVHVRSVDPSLIGFSWLEPPLRFGFVVTPLCVSVFRRELEDNPDWGSVYYVCDGIQHGFRTGFCPELVHLRSSSRNMRSVSDHPDVVDAYFGTELSEGSVIGHFTDPPFPNLHCSPF